MNTFRLVERRTDISCFLNQKYDWIKNFVLVCTFIFPKWTPESFKRDKSRHFYHDDHFPPRFIQGMFFFRSQNVNARSTNKQNKLAKDELYSKLDQYLEARLQSITVIVTVICQPNAQISADILWYLLQMKGPLNVAGVFLNTVSI